MKLNRYRNELAIFLFWAVSVIIIFRSIEDKQIAAVIAGAGFVIWPLYFLFLEIRSIQKSRIHIIALSAFLILAALPIFILRLTHWGADFKSLSLLGIQATTLHQFSNVIYLVVMISCFYHSWKWDRLARGQQDAKDLVSRRP
ncbi:MAG: hypothetical protein H7061_04315 [Bdellovibrionaceae bacterium]|nr:hypothetical protein [Bdellovibrio sp.]